MPDAEKKEKRAAELLADWRAASRDTVAATGAAKVAEMALVAAAAAEEAALEVEEAADAAVDAAERARRASGRAKTAAAEAAKAATWALETAKGDKVRASQGVKAAAQAESEARDLFHDKVDDNAKKR
ncbi:MAG TPA: hypothetical protein VFP83_02620 [Candidatus Limnocylindria bacterium]|nr:hypothetical protein [Candidatus Limnocylindria bacterium]